MPRDMPSEGNRVPLIQVAYILREFGGQVETQPRAGSTVTARIRLSSSTGVATCSSVTETCGDFVTLAFPARSSAIRSRAWLSSG